MTEPAVAIKAAATSVLSALRWRVAVKDEAFDRLYPEHVRRLSSIHWTPVSVALRAAQLLAPDKGMRILDVGCGPGKLCCVGALVQGGTWHGVERDSSLVAVATAAAAALEISHCTTFTAGDMGVVDWKQFDGLYFFNPFAAQLFGIGPPEPLARWSALKDQISRTEIALAELAVGTRVVTYQGFGGDLPGSYTLSHMEAVGDGQLSLWIKQPGTARARSPSWSEQF